MGGRLALGARFAGAACRIVADRIDEARGAALPRTPEQLARPEVLSALFGRDAGPGAPALPAVRSARLPGVDFESSNCRNFLVELEFAGGSEDGGALPRSLYAKLPGEQLATRAFAHATGFWRAEVAFERARRCLEAFATLHAAFWALAGDERERLLPGRFHPYLAPGGRERNRALNAAAIGPAHRAAPGIFTKRHAAVCREAVAKWDALLDFWYSGPLTLVHGDSHLANCFEYEAPEGLRVGLLDFQGVQWCQGVRDVQYFLIDSLDSAILAECEEELLCSYLDALAKAGIAQGLEQARALYRAFAFQTLMVAVVSLGLGSLSEREATVRRLLERSVAAIDRLGFADLLAGL